MSSWARVQRKRSRSSLSAIQRGKRIAGRRRPTRAGDSTASVRMRRGSEVTPRRAASARRASVTWLGTSAGTETRERMRRRSRRVRRRMASAPRDQRERRVVQRERARREEKDK
jgi:hypothetical protein